MRPDAFVHTVGTEEAAFGLNRETYPGRGAPLRHGPVHRRGVNREVVWLRCHGWKRLSDAKYISLTTYRADGSAKSTPVWFAGSDGAYLVYTGAEAWKIKRLRANPAVQVRVCDVRGRVDPDATVYAGSAEVLDDPADVDRAVARSARSTAGRPLS